MDNGSKYHKTIGSIGNNPHYVKVDVYDVLSAFGVACPARQHAIKKLLCAGQRGSKTAIQDLEEASVSIARAIELAKVAERK